jgi:hypothetical protein
MKNRDSIYYIVRLPQRWRVLANAIPDSYHAEWWTEFVTGYVAGAWAKHLGTPVSALKNQLENLPYAFPRGRLSGSVFYHGNDLTPKMRITQRHIENAFGLNGVKVRWRLDEHEQCQSLDREEMCSALGITEYWSSV